MGQYSLEQLIDECRKHEQISEFERWWVNYREQLGLEEPSFKQIAQAAWNAAKTRAGT